MGLHISVYRSASADCTNDGVTKRFAELCVTNVEGPFEPNENTPAVKLVAGHAPGTVRIVPEEVGERWSCFGGNFATTCDSRFSNAVEKITGAVFYGAVAVHDRVE